MNLNNLKKNHLETRSLLRRKNTNVYMFLSLFSYFQQGFFSHVRVSFSVLCILFSCAFKLLKIYVSGRQSLFSKMQFLCKKLLNISGENIYIRPIYYSYQNVNAAFFLRQHCTNLSPSTLLIHKSKQFFLQ